MKPCNPALLKVVLFAISMVILVLPMACGSPTRLVSINLHEPEINQLIQDSKNITSSDGWSFLVDDVEIQDGFIRVNGMYTPLVGDRVLGSLDISLFVEDGSLKGKIKRLNFQGYAAPDQALQVVDDLIVGKFSQGASEGRSEVKFVSVETLPGVIKLALRFIP